MADQNIKTVIEGNAFYEIDVNCLQERERERKQKADRAGLHEPVKKRQRN